MWLKLGGRKCLGICAYCYGKPECKLPLHGAVNSHHLNMQTAGKFPKEKASGNSNDSDDGDGGGDEASGVAGGGVGSGSGSGSGSDNGDSSDSSSGTTGKGHGAEPVAGAEAVLALTWHGILEQKLMPLVPSNCDHDEICAACSKRGQVEIVEGELLLACSFCNEAWHDAKECIGTMRPVPADEEERACPSCIAEATASRATTEVLFLLEIST